MNYSAFRPVWWTHCINDISFGFVAQGLVVKGFGVAFLYESRTFEKTGFCQKGILEKYIYFLQEKPIEKWQTVLKYR